MSQHCQHPSNTQGTTPNVTEQHSALELEDILKQLHPDLRETFVLLKKNNGVFSAEQINAIFGENPPPLHDLVQLIHEKSSAK